MPRTPFEALAKRLGLQELLRHVFEHRAFEAEVTAKRANGQEFELDMELVPVEDGGTLG